MSNNRSGETGAHQERRRRAVDVANKQTPSVWRAYSYAWITLAFFVLTITGHWISVGSLILTNTGRWASRPKSPDT
jgi:hypothetical protein